MLSSIVLVFVSPLPLLLSILHLSRFKDELLISFENNCKTNPKKISPYPNFKIFSFLPFFASRLLSSFSSAKITCSPISITTKNKIETPIMSKKSPIEPRCESKKSSIILSLVRYSLLPLIRFSPENLTQPFLQNCT